MTIALYYRLAEVRSQFAILHLSEFLMEHTFICDGLQLCVEITSSANVAAVSEPLQAVQGFKVQTSWGKYSALPGVDHQCLYRLLSATHSAVWGLLSHNAASTDDNFFRFICQTSQTIQLPTFCF
jgi:hypothetical protein